MLVLLLAAVLGEAHLDIDADGRPDLVQLFADGRIEARAASGARLGELRLGKAAAGLRGPGRIRAHRIGSHTLVEVRAPLRGRRAEAALVFELAAPGELGVVFEGMLGPQGRDGEWSRTLEVAEGALLVYEQATQVARCDRAPVRLFPRAYDPETRRLRPVELAPATAGLPLLHARRVAESSRPEGRAFRPQSASRSEGARAAEEIVPPLAVGDKDPRTVWRGEPGDFVTLRAEAPAAVRAVALAGRVGRAILALGPERRYLLEGTGLFALPEPVRTECVTLVLAEGPAEIAELEVAVAEPISKEAVGEKVRPAAGSEPPPRPEELPRLVEALGGKETAEAEQALVRAGGAAVPGCAQRLADARAPEPARLRAAGVLGGIAERGDPAAAQALLDALGSGSPSLRSGVVAAATHLPLASGPALLDLLERATAEPRPERAADGARVVAALVRREAGLRQPAVPPLSRALGATRAFELRVRLAQALGATGEPSAAAALAAVASPAGEADDVVRWEATKALASLSGPAADAALFGATGDPSPRVRDAAVVALGRRKAAAPTATDVLARALRDDRWMFVRRDAAEALGGRCGDPAGAALRAAVTRHEEDDDVRRSALAALVRCHDPGAPALLVTIAAAEAEEPALRAEACTLAGRAGDRSLRGPLVDLAEKLGKTLRDPKPRSEEILAACLSSIGLLAAPATPGEAVDPPASRLLLRFAEDKDAPGAVKTSAIEGLGRLCDPAAQAALARLAHGDARVHRLATGLLDQCRPRPPAAPP